MAKGSLNCVRGTTHRTQETKDKCIHCHKAKLKTVNRPSQANKEIIMINGKAHNNLAYNKNTTYTGFDFFNDEPVTALDKELSKIMEIENNNFITIPKSEVPVSKDSDEYHVIMDNWNKNKIITKTVNGEVVCPFQECSTKLHSSMKNCPILRRQIKDLIYLEEAREGWVRIKKQRNHYNQKEKREIQDLTRDLKMERLEKEITLPEQTEAEPAKRKWWKRKKKETKLSTSNKPIITKEYVQNAYDNIQMDWFEYEINPTLTYVEMPALLNTNYPGIKEYHDLKYQLWERMNSNDTNYKELNDLCEKVSQSWIKAQAIAKEQGSVFLTTKEQQLLSQVPAMMSKLENDQTNEFEREATMNMLLKRVDRIDNNDIKSNLSRVLLGTQNQLEKSKYRKPIIMQEVVREGYQLAIGS